MIRDRRIVLFLASFLLLYFELVLIRWVPGQVRVLAYFTNFVLIACFFGMGLGMMLTGSRHDFGRWAPGAVALLVLLTIPCKFLWVGMIGGADAGLFTEYEGISGVQIALFPVLLTFYLAIAAAFVPFGQIIGRAFGAASPLASYALNLLGSMAGIVVFFVYSWLSLPAWSWFLLGMPLLALLVPSAGWYRAGALLVSLAVTGAVWYMDRGTIWSPYHKIDIAACAIDRETGKLVVPYNQRNLAAVEFLPPEVGFSLRVNDDFYQMPINLSDEIVARYPASKLKKAQYELPFRLKPNAERVLIVGGGTGNDTAAALRWGARQVDMVDIDPRIVALGRQGHPERPQTDSRPRLRPGLQRTGRRLRGHRRVPLPHPGTAVPLLPHRRVLRPVVAGPAEPAQSPGRSRGRSRRDRRAESYQAVRLKGRGPALQARRAPQRTEPGVGLTEPRVVGTNGKLPWRAWCMVPAPARAAR